LLTSGAVIDRLHSGLELLVCVYRVCRQGLKRAGLTRTMCCLFEGGDSRTLVRPVAKGFDGEAAGGRRVQDGVSG
jgi:hypothetical protein